MAQVTRNPRPARPAGPAAADAAGASPRAPHPPGGREARDRRRDGRAGRDGRCQGRGRHLPSWVAGGRRPEPMRPTLLPTLLLAAAAVSGCGRKATAPEPLAGGTSAVLVATHPPARSTSVIYDTEIWGEFDRALDPATVTPRSVFLKLDGARIPSTVTYEAATRRIHLRPTVVLELRRTYTVEFTPAVLDAGGTPLPPGIFFQFSTNSLRRVAYDYPTADALEGPVVTLGWGGTQIPVNEIFYEVYAGADSAAVAGRAVASLQRTVFTRFLPHAAWPAGSRVFWAVTSENLLTGERMDGPVQTFRVLPASVPVEEASVSLRDVGSSDIRNRNVQYCTRQTLPAGPSFNAAIHWNYSTVPAGARLVGATLTLTALDGNAGATGGANSGVWLSQNDWTACSVLAPGPPYPELSGHLASGNAVTPIQLDFSSDRLAAFVEAMARQRTLLSGLLVRTPLDVQFHSALAFDSAKHPRLVIRFQRVPPRPPS